jgi:hypothetical protein
MIRRGRREPIWGMVDGWAKQKSHTKTRSHEGKAEKAEKYGAEK